MLLSGCGLADRIRPGVKIIVFTMDGCTSCEEAKPHLKRMQKAGADVRIADVRIPEDAKLAKYWNIKTVPTFIVQPYRDSPSNLVITRDIYRVWRAIRIGL
jgi:thiol-disulfide isomerase/thioredoxin